MTALVHREAGPADGPPVLFLHGFPESSHVWRHVLRPVGEAGWRAVAPDLAGLGDSPPDLPGTWERHVEAVERFADDHGLDDVVLAAHDWGGMIGLAWACEHPGRLRGLVLSSTGFFPDGKWHGLGQTLRSPEGEAALAAFTPELLGRTLRTLSPGMDDPALHEYAKCLDGPERRQAILDFYRSMDFEKLARYDGCLPALGVPALIVWGGRDPFSPPAGAHRLQAELPGSDLLLVEDAGHFVWDDAPDRTREALLRFLGTLSR